MKVKDFLKLLEWGTSLLLWDEIECKELVEDRWHSYTKDKFSPYLDRTIVAINTNESNIDIELVLQ